MSHCNLMCSKDISYRFKKSFCQECADTIHCLYRHDARGFLVNKKYLPGSVLCCGRLATLWAADEIEAITKESLSLLMLMQPSPGQAP